MGSGDDEMEEASGDNGSESEESDVDRSDIDNGSNSDDDSINPEGKSTVLVDEDLLDEMDEFGYSGLDQVEEADKEREDHLGEDAFGAEDGENIKWEWEDDDFSHGYL